MTKDTMIGEPLYRKKLSRPSFRKFMAEQPPAVVVMEACTDDPGRWPIETRRVRDVFRSMPVVMHRMLSDGTCFDPKQAAA
jgi:hypothetical protein